MWSAPPPLAMYTFVGNAGYKGDDGMEHLNSTQIITPHALVDTAAVDDYLDYAVARILPRVEREADTAGVARAIRLHVGALRAELVGG